MKQEANTLAIFHPFSTQKGEYYTQKKIVEKETAKRFLFLSRFAAFFGFRREVSHKLDHSESFPLDQATPGFHAFVLLNSSKQSIAKIPPKFKHVQFGPCVAQKCGFVKVTFLYFVICLRLFVCFHVFSCTVLKVIKCLLWHNY